MDNVSKLKLTCTRQKFSHDYNNHIESKCKPNEPVIKDVRVGKT
jgi:hypothetical protein